MIDDWLAHLAELARDAGCASASDVRLVHWSLAEESNFERAYESARSRHPDRSWPALAWYRTGFDAEGLADVVPLGARPPGRAEVQRRAYRALWKTVLEGTAPRTVSAALPRDAAVLREVAGLAAEGAGRALGVEALAADARDFEALEAAARRLEELDARLFRLGAMHEAAALLVQVFRFEKENLEGEDVGALARATRLVHEELAARARLLAEMLEPAGAVRPALPQGGNHASVR